MDHALAVLLGLAIGACIGTLIFYRREARRAYLRAEEIVIDAVCWAATPLANLLVRIPPSVVGWALRLAVIVSIAAIVLAIVASECSGWYTP